MRTTTRLCLVLAVVATAGVVAVPATAGAKARASHHADSKQKLKKKLKKRMVRANNRIDRLKEIGENLQLKDLDQDATAKSIKDTLDAAIPVVTKALQDLEAGLTTVGEGLTTLAAAYQSVEYGVAKIFATGATPTIAAGGSTISADVPDDGNSIQTNETAIIVAGASAAMAIDLRADIRSNEEDNDAGDTVGQAGGFVSVRNFDSGAHVDCIGAPDPPGILGTTAGDSIVTPSGTVTNLPIKNLPGGLERTDTTHPDASSVNLLPASCTFVAAAGTTYAVDYSVNFVDIPTTTTPGGTE